MTHVDLFSGIGGFSLAAEQAGFETIAFCEIDPFARMVLEERFPGVPICDDIRQFTTWFIRRFGDVRVDILTGGFPCQDLSLAGEGAGLGTEEDPTRSGLWFAMRDAIRGLRPTIVVAENVRGILSKRGLLAGESAADTVLRQLEEEGYEAQAYMVAASDVGATHQRERLIFYAERREAGVALGNACLRRLHG